MKNLKIVDAGLDGSVVFELNMSKNFSNLNGTYVPRSLPYTPTTPAKSEYE
jgi:hypothetical protein